MILKITKTLNWVTANLSIKVLALIFASIMPCICYAYDINKDGIYYNILSKSGNTVEVTKPGFKYADDITIPNTIRFQSKDYKVFAIGDHAFEGSTKLRSVTIPASVNSIGSYAFDGCVGLKYIFLQSKTPVVVKGDIPNDVKKRTILFIPKGSISEYQNSSVWKDFTNIREK